MSTTETTPNVLLMFADQQRFDSVECNGAPICATPHLDRLAEHGQRFTNAYTPISLCSPARASLLTGLYPHNHGQLANLRNFNGVFDTQVLDKPAWTQLLAAAGYQTAYVGKWHLPKEHDPHWGIDEWHTTGDFFRSLRERGVQHAGYAQEVQRLEWGGDAPFCGRSVLRAEEKEEAWDSERAIGALERFAASADGRPFALTVSFFGPHFPYAVPAPYDTMYDPALVPLWRNFDEHFHGKPTIQQREQLRWNASHLTWVDWQRVIAHYWGYCTYIDAQVGRILDRLDALGLTDNTLIIYTSDHGDMLGSHRLFNKGPYMYDETYRVPLIIRWPHETGCHAVSNAFVNGVDLMPTILDVCGVTAPENIDGRSLTPLRTDDPPDDWRDDVFAEFHGYEPCLFTQRMVRTASWKYIYNPCAEDELYDVVSDPGELHNLANDLGYKHVLRRMKERLVAWLHETGDSIGEDDPWKGTPYDLFLSGRERN